MPGRPARHRRSNRQAEVVVRAIGAQNRVTLSGYRNGTQSAGGHSELNRLHVTEQHWERWAALSNRRLGSSLPAPARLSRALHRKSLATSTRLEQATNFKHAKTDGEERTRPGAYMVTTDRATDPEYLGYQYDDSEKLRIRVEAHERYSERGGEHFGWILEPVMHFEPCSREAHSKGRAGRVRRTARGWCRVDPRRAGAGRHSEVVPPGSRQPRTSLHAGVVPQSA